MNNQQNLTNKNWYRNTNRQRLMTLYKIRIYPNKLFTFKGEVYKYEL